MAKAVKFTFGESFDETGTRPEPPPPPAIATYEEAEVAELVEQARTQARAEGEAAARAGIERTLADTMARVIGEVGTLVDDAGAAERRLGVEAARLGHAIGTKLATRLMEAHPLAEIEAMVSECLAEAATEPRVVIRLQPDLVEPMKARIDALAEATGHQGKLVLLGDNRMGPGDARVEWANGGAERDLGAIAAAVAAAIERHAAQEQDG